MKQASEKLVPIVLAFCDLLEGVKFDDKKINEIKQALTQVELFHRCNYNYFIGMALQEQGLDDESSTFWQQSAFQGPFNFTNSTLAGHRLVLKHGPMRGGPPTQENALNVLVEDAADAEEK